MKTSYIFNNGKYETDNIENICDTSKYPKGNKLEELIGLYCSYKEKDGIKILKSKEDKKLIKIHSLNATNNFIIKLTDGKDVVFNHETRDEIVNVDAFFYDVHGTNREELILVEYLFQGIHQSIEVSVYTVD